MHRRMTGRGPLPLPTDICGYTRYRYKNLYLRSDPYPGVCPWYSLAMIVMARRRKMAEEEMNF